MLEVRENAGSHSTSSTLTWSEALANREQTPMKSHIRRWVPKGGYTMMVSDPGAGKTWVAMSMAVAIATGTPWMGCNTTPGRVLYYGCEVKDSLEVRLRAYQAGTGLAPYGTLSFVTEDCRGILDIYSDRLVADVIRHEADLVIVDPLVHALTRVDPDNNDQVRELTHQLTKTLSAHGCDLLLVHHTAKASGGYSDVFAGRGAGDWGGGAISVINLDRIGDRRQISRSKVCNSPAPESLVISLKEEWDMREDGDYLMSAMLCTESRSRVIEEINEERVDKIVDLLKSDGPMSGKQIDERLGWSQSMRTRAMRFAGERVIYDEKDNIYTAAPCGVTESPNQ